MCSPCGGYPCVPTHGHEPCCPNGGCLGNGQCGDGSCGSGFDAPATGYQQGYPQGYQQGGPQGYQGQAYPQDAPNGYEEIPLELPMPTPAESSGRHGELVLPPDAGASLPADRVQGPAIDRTGRAMSDLSRRPSPHYTASRNPQYQRQSSEPFNPQSSAGGAGGAAGNGGLIGPVGYDLD